MLGPNYLPMLIDSHCHLDRLNLAPYDGDLTKAVAAAREKNVSYILCPGIDLENFPSILTIAESDHKIFAAVGVHPSVQNTQLPSLAELLALAQHEKVVAIGETGLDFSYACSASQRQYQSKLFQLHIQAATILNKPLIIHSREAEADITQILTTAKTKGVMHCFTGSAAMAATAINLSFYISFSGIITFRNADALRDIAKTIPLEKMLIETDAPYLAPVPMRGKPNEPSYLPYIAEFIAKLRGISYQTFAAQIAENFWRFCSHSKI